MIYFDNSATTFVLREAAERACSAMTSDYYNPSAAYGAAYGMEKQVEAARRYFASLLFAKPEEIVFTSGGTESNNMAVFGTLSAHHGPKEIVTTATEHPSVYDTVLAAAKQWNATVRYAPLKPDGTVDVSRLDEVLNEKTALVSIMHVNNELGSINPLSEIREKLHQYAPQAIFHSDGVQGFLKCQYERGSVDLYSISAHKLHAPKGIGLLYVKNGTHFAGGQIGGGQERGLRGGTTNVPAILGMETALRIYRENLPEWHDRMLQVKKRLSEHLLSLPDVLLNGPSVEEGAPHILNLSFVGVRGEVLLHALEQKDICVSTGSACSAKKLGKNRILSSVGIQGARQEGALRFSFSPFNTVSEADMAAEIIEEQLAVLRRYKRR